MIVGRIVGWIVLLAGLSVLVRDLLLLVDTGRWVPLGFGEAWRTLDPAGFAAFGAALPAVMLALWLCAGLTVLGFVLIVACRRRLLRRR